MTKIIKILGTGCPRCQQTVAVVEDVVKQNGIDAIIEKVENITDIMKYNVLATPAVVVDEEIKIKGRVPTPSEINALLQ
jgi:small redox-active disulfide protein 2